MATSAKAGPWTRFRTKLPARPSEFTRKSPEPSNLTMRVLPTDSSSLVMMAEIVITPLERVKAKLPSMTWSKIVRLPLRLKDTSSEP